MSNDSKKLFPECKAIDDVPGLAPGWGCCNCRTYNGNQRPECKLCGHTRCDHPAIKKILVLEEPDDAEEDDLPSNWEIN